MAYGSKLYVGMALINNGGHIKVVLNMVDSHFVYSHFAYTKLVLFHFAYSFLTCFIWDLSVLSVLKVWHGELYSTKNN